jgi:hypothetical protein
MMATLDDGLEPALQTEVLEQAYCVLEADNLLLPLDFQRFH